LPGIAKSRTNGDRYRQTGCSAQCSTGFAEVLQNIYHDQLLGGRWRESAAKKL
jgi:hypothetical protein